MEDHSVRLDLRFVAIGAVLLAVGALITLVAAEGSDAALARTALVLAVIAFVADLLIAMVTQMTAAQTEARLRDTNTDMQSALAKVDERTEEIRNLVRLQGERLLDMVGRRLVEEAPLAERQQVATVVGQIRDRLQAEYPLEPPLGGIAGRRQRLVETVNRWVDGKKFHRIAPKDDDAVTFEADGAIYDVHVKAGRYHSPVDVQDLDWDRQMHSDDWPGREVHSVLVVEDPELSGWDGRQPPKELPGMENVQVVTSANLDDILLGSSPDGSSLG